MGQSKSLLAFPDLGAYVWETQPSLSPLYTKGPLHQLLGVSGRKKGKMGGCACPGFTCPSSHPPLLQQKESPLAKCPRPSPQQPGLLGAYHHGGGENPGGRGEQGWECCQA